MEKAGSFETSAYIHQITSGNIPQNKTTTAYTASISTAIQSVITTTITDSVTLELWCASWNRILIKLDFRLYSLSVYEFRNSTFK